MKCTRINCPMQAGTKTDNCGENCPWRTEDNLNYIKQSDIFKMLEMVAKHHLEVCMRFEKDMCEIEMRPWEPTVYNMKCPYN